MGAEGARGQQRQVCCTATFVQHPTRWREPSVGAARDVLQVRARLMVCRATGRLDRAFCAEQLAREGNSWEDSDNAGALSELVLN